MRRLQNELIPAKESLERDAGSNLWRNTLSQIPSVYGRLVYLSSLRDANSARYTHHGLALVFGEDEANRALRKSHNHAFAEWLAFGIEQQKADLDLYISGLFQSKKSVLEAWITLAPYRYLIPNSAKSVERRLYLTDLQALLELLRNEFGAGVPDRDA